MQMPYALLLQRNRTFSTDMKKYFLSLYFRKIFFQVTLLSVELGALRRSSPFKYKIKDSPVY